MIGWKYRKQCSGETEQLKCSWIGLDQAEHLSVQTGQGQTPKFAGRALLDRTKSRLYIYTKCGLSIQLGKGTCTLIWCHNPRNVDAFEDSWFIDRIDRILEKKCIWNTKSIFDTIIKWLSDTNCFIYFDKINLRSIAINEFIEYFKIAKLALRNKIITKNSIFQKW